MPPRAKNIVMVHGLFADGSCWSEVIARLQPKGLNVTTVQNPLTMLDAAVAETQKVLARQQGPTVLVDHSFSGMIVTGDRTISPDLERFMAKRMGAATIEVKASHLPLVSQPDAITDLILRAACMPEDPRGSSNAPPISPA